jgi:hypothetical protein
VDMQVRYVVFFVGNINISVLRRCRPLMDAHRVREGTRKQVVVAFSDRGKDVRKRQLLCLG